MHTIYWFVYARARHIHTGINVLFLFYFLFWRWCCCSFTFQFSDTEFKCESIAMECMLVLCCLAFTFQYILFIFFVPVKFACLLYVFGIAGYILFFSAPQLFRSVFFFAFATCTAHKTLVRYVYLCICVSTTLTIILYLAAFWKIGSFFSLSHEHKKNNKFDSTVGFFLSLLLCFSLSIQFSSFRFLCPMMMPRVTLQKFCYWLFFSF